jgi:hypothetical protein
MVIFFRFFSISGWKAQYAIAQGSSLLLTYDYGQFEIEIPFLLRELLFNLVFSITQVP